MVKIINAGFYSTIQDKGRFGFSQYGVPISGTMDVHSAKLANYILGNSEEDALLEATMVGPKLQFYCDTSICITGADMSASLNNEPIKMNSVIAIRANDILSFSKANLGFRSYLAIKGGFRTEEIMKSRSMYRNITKNKILRKDDLLIISEKENTLHITNAAIRVDSSHIKQLEIEVFKGPEFNLLSEENMEKLFNTEFTISKNNNRMAYQLEEAFDNDLSEIITSLVMPGTIQLTPSGQLIILMRDCQTTGGYPRVLQLKESSLNVLAQKYTGNIIRFRLLD